MKDIYELLNDLNIDSSDVEEAEVNEIERQIGKRKLMSSLNKRKSNNKRIAIAAASLLLITSIVSVIFENPTWADNIPIIGDLFQKNLINVNKEYADYMNTIGETKSQDGIEVTFENAVADKNMFTFSFIVKNNNAPIKDPELLANAIMFLNINGKDINMSGSSGCEIVDKNTVKYLRTVDWEDKDLPKYLNVKIDIPSMFDVEGDWGVKFSMDTKDISKNTYVEKLNNKFNVDNIDFGLDEVDISPLTTNIKYHANNDEYVNMGFLVLDQDNNEVKFAGGESKNKDCEGGEAGKIKFSMNYINNGDVSSLKLIPLYYDKNNIEKKLESKRIDLTNFKPLEVNLNENLSISIDECIVDDGNLIIKYNYKYLGKKITGIGKKDFSIAANEISLEENTDDDLNEKYISSDYNIKIYKISNEKNIQMDFYDGAASELLENEAVTVAKK